MVGFGVDGHNYHRKFLSNFSTPLAPLHPLLMKHTNWAWADAQEKAFQEVKKQLTTSPLLAHYDPKKEVILSCDASPYGIRAVLSHIMEDGTEHPIAFTSRSLSAAEKNYSQLEREGFSFVLGVKKFHPYLFGRTFTILSDHQPLKHLFGVTSCYPLGLGPHTTLGTDPQCIPIQDGIQARGVPRQCRCPKSPSATRGTTNTPIPGEPRSASTDCGTNRTMD